jgi:hypothetical protein
MKNHSASNFGKDFGVVHEAVITGRKVGADEKFWAKLAHNEDLFSRFVKVAEGYAEENIKPIKYIIDCDVPPFIPDGWGVEKHEKGGEFEWNPEKVKFYISKKQQNRGCIEGNKLRKELENKSTLNANVLDWLLKHTDLIPENWKKDKNGNTRYIFFWGTIYRRPDGYLFVRHLYWYDGQWNWSYNWLGHVWRGNDPALLLAS